MAEYEALGYPILRTSAVTGEGLPSLRKLLAQPSRLPWASLSGATYPTGGSDAAWAVPSAGLIVGQSGTGKSSLVNGLRPELRIDTSELSRNRGVHTTTATRLWHLPGGGSLFDSPGVALFSPEPANLDDVAKGFRELAQMPACRYKDCHHVTESGCLVREAVKAGQLSARRYASYVQLHDMHEERIQDLKGREARTREEARQRSHRKGLAVKKVRALASQGVSESDVIADSRFDNPEADEKEEALAEDHLAAFAAPSKAEQQTLNSALEEMKKEKMDAVLGYARKKQAQDQEEAEQKEQTRVLDQVWLGWLCVLFVFVVPGLFFFTFALVQSISYLSIRLFQWNTQSINHSLILQAILFLLCLCSKMCSHRDSEQARRKAAVIAAARAKREKAREKEREKERREEQSAKVARALAKKDRNL